MTALTEFYEAFLTAAPAVFTLVLLFEARCTAFSVVFVISRVLNDFPLATNT